MFKFHHLKKCVICGKHFLIYIYNVNIEIMLSKSCKFKCPKCETPYSFKLVLSNFN